MASHAHRAKGLPYQTLLYQKHLLRLLSQLLVDALLHTKPLLHVELHVELQGSTALDIALSLGILTCHPLGQELSSFFEPRSSLPHLLQVLPQKPPSP